MTGWWFGTMEFYDFPLGIIIPTDYHIFQRGWNHQPDDDQWLLLGLQIAYKLFSGHTHSMNWTICKCILDQSRIAFSARIGSNNQPCLTNGCCRQSSYCASPKWWQGCGLRSKSWRTMHNSSIGWWTDIHAGFCGQWTYNSSPKWRPCCGVWR